MTVVAVVIPWRPGTAQRNAHHDYVRQHLRAVIPSALHIGVDSGVDSGHTPFSRAGSRNKGVRIAQASGADIVVICDADTLVEAEPLHEAIAAAGDGRLHLPYTWYRGLSEAGTQAYLDGTDPALCPTDWEHEWATGGVLVIQPDAWWAAVIGLLESAQGCYECSGACSFNGLLGLDESASTRGQSGMMQGMGKWIGRGRPWGPGDRTGGPLDAVFEQVRGCVPGLVVERLGKTHEGDDDNLFFLGVGSDFHLVQLECCPGGMGPFLVEDDDSRASVSDPGEAVAALLGRLGRSRESAG